MVAPAESPSSGVAGGRRSIRRLVVAVVATLAVVMWWWWPGLVGDPDDVDVRVALGDDLAVADQSIDRRLREEGFLLERVSAPDDWCEVAGLITEAPDEVSRIVVWAPTTTGCDIDDAVSDIVAATDGRRVVVVHLPTDDPAVREAFGHGAVSNDIVTVETTRLLGEPGAIVECLWWEDCPASGVVEPWNGDSLGPIGAERLARMIVTATI
ncbi:MAG: hypothetical protein RIS41_2111 [Actinomycetota bacterium]|jgi:hypothetical protein